MAAAPPGEFTLCSALCGKAAFKGQKIPILDTVGEKFSRGCYAFLEVFVFWDLCKGPGGMPGPGQNTPGMSGMPGK